MTTIHEDDAENQLSTGTPNRDPDQQPDPPTSRQTTASSRWTAHREVIHDKPETHTPTYREELQAQARKLHDKQNHTRRIRQ